MLPTMLIVLGTVVVAIGVVFLIARLVNDSPFKELERSFLTIADQFGGSLTDEGWYSGLACEFDTEGAHVLVHPAPSGGGILQSHYRVEIRASRPNEQHAVSRVLAIEDAIDSEKLIRAIEETAALARGLESVDSEQDA